MIASNLSTLMGQRRLKIAELARETGISRGALTRLYHDNFDRLDTETIGRLCAYFQIGVGDLIEYRSVRDDSGRENAAGSAIAQPRQS